MPCNMHNITFSLKKETEKILRSDKMGDFCFCTMQPTLKGTMNCEWREQNITASLDIIIMWLQKCDWRNEHRRICCSLGSEPYAFQ